MSAVPFLYLHSIYLLLFAIPCLARAIPSAAILFLAGGSAVFLGVSLGQSEDTPVVCPKRQQDNLHWLGLALHTPDCATVLLIPYVAACRDLYGLPNLTLITRGPNKLISAPANLLLGAEQMCPA